MAIPSDPLARKFYRVALARIDDMGVLYDEARFAGGVYLGGYVVECVLKSLLIGALPRDQRSRMMGLFRGSLGHDLFRLRSAYVGLGGASIPAEIIGSFEIVDAWSVASRYDPKVPDRRSAEEFRRAVHSVFAWADGRLL